MTNTPPSKLSEREVKDELARVPEWSEFGGQIQRTYQFKNFVASMAFVNTVAEYAERVQHHPDILVRWNKVTLTVSTHDAGGITQKDFDLARHADSVSGVASVVSTIAATKTERKPAKKV